MSTHAGLFTANDLIRMPNNGNRRELIAELHQMAPSGFEHGRVTMQFSGRLNAFVQEHNLGVVLAAETGFLLSKNPDTVRAPDVAFITRERITKTPPTLGYFPGAPDLAVEVISPSDTYSEVEAKVEDWLDAGCQTVIVVNPRNRTLKVYRSIVDIVVLTAAESFDGRDLLPGFVLAVRDVFTE